MSDNNVNPKPNVCKEFWPAFQIRLIYSRENEIKAPYINIITPPVKPKPLQIRA